MLDAAAAEFAERGISGARVDRIAEVSGVNKSQMYSYFGSKDGLFDAALRDNLAVLLDAVPLTADDLPGYAARLYDAYVERPEHLRLAVWNRLERVPTGDLWEDFGGHGENHDENKLGAIARAQRDGLVDPAFTPQEVFMFVVAIANTWAPVNVTVAAGSEDGDAEHARRRSVIAEVVSRALLTTGSEGKGTAGAGTTAGRGHRPGKGELLP